VFCPEGSLSDSWVECLANCGRTVEALRTALGLMSEVADDGHGQLLMARSARGFILSPINR
jgi:hypothetical protein